jgi:hypothetical protein
MTRLVLLEWIIIAIALLSLWPVIIGYSLLWYKLYLLVVLGALIWVTRNRLARIRDVDR